MAAHRYWRAVALEAYGAGDLELSCFHLLDVSGTRVDAPATLTASTAPATGAVANLQDDDLTTGARWSPQSVATLSLNWDFGGSPVDVSDIRLAGDSNVRFALIAKIQYSDDASVWVDSVTFSGITWPGATIKTTSVALGFWNPGDRGGNAFAMADRRVVSSRASGGFVRSAKFRSTGIYQFEALIGAGSAGVGVATRESSNADFFGNNAGSWSAYATQKYNNGATAAYGSFIAGNVVGVVVDFGAGTLTYYKNGVSVGAAFTNLAGKTVAPAAGYLNGTLGSTITLKTQDFTYPVAGALAWEAGSAVLQGVAATKTTDAITVGTGPAIIYGISQVVEPVNLTIESGSVKDYTTGVMGSGRGRVAGTVKEKGTPDAPVYRKVRLIREVDSLLIRELWSHPVTGAYSFDYVDELQKFTVLSYDHTGAFRAVVADGQIPELIA